MFVLNAENAVGYLGQANLAGRDSGLVIRELSGGVSSTVLLATFSDDGLPWVIKQAREQLSVREPWYCSRERILREAGVSDLCEEIAAFQACVLEDGRKILFAVPDIVLLDDANFVIVMEAAPQPHVSWKEELLVGLRDPDIAQAAGSFLALLHCATWKNDIGEQFADRTFFEQLRLDPYYRHAALSNPDLQPTLEALATSVSSHCLCLVHGDYSPKNLIVTRPLDSARPITLTLIDFEVGHFGDPAFDVGFFLTHLVLKAVAAPAEKAEALSLADAFVRTYSSGLACLLDDAERTAVINRGMLHLAGCLLARIDGKSRVDYLPEVRQQEAVRQLAREFFAARPTDWNAARPIIERAIASIS